MHFEFHLTLLFTLRIWELFNLMGVILMNKMYVYTYINMYACVIKLLRYFINLLRCSTKFPTNQVQLFFLFENCLDQIFPKTNF